MPNRIIKETIVTSKKVGALTDFQFRVWIYLITYVDDYGRGSADVELLKGFLFSRRKGVTESQIRDALNSLAMSGMILLYEVEGEPYFAFPNWNKHQRIQTKRSKFPEPPETCNLQQLAIGKEESKQLEDVKGESQPLITVGHRDPPIESESNPNPNPNSNVRQSKYSDGFEDFWKAYPRKKDKATAYKQYLARLKQGWSPDEMLIAATNYAAECKKNHTEEKYTKLGATFLSATTPFVDYIPKRAEEPNGNRSDVSNPFLDYGDPDQGFSILGDVVSEVLERNKHE